MKSATPVLLTLNLLLLVLLTAACPSAQEPESSPTCAFCGGPIVGPYVTALGKHWHPEHFKCANCQRPILEARFFEKDGRAYCEDCYHELFSPRCDICGLPIRSTYATNVWGEIYCEKHEREFERCYSCGRLICEELTGGGVEYDDGRWLCNRCRDTAIDTAADGEGVLEEVRRTLGWIGFDLGDATLPLRVVDQSELAAVDGHGRDPNGHITTRTWTEDGRVVGREVAEILILDGLPKEHFAAIAAHELGHAWLFLQGYPELPPYVEEGLCQLSSYLWLDQQNTLEADCRMRLIDVEEDPVYGYGFRCALGSLERYSLPALLAYVRRNGRFPVEDEPASLR